MRGFALSLLLVNGGCTIALPKLNINPTGISISGLSSGADFTVQFQVAFSSLLKGSGVFAGQPYHCAVTRFPNDSLVSPDPSVPLCDTCPPNTTLAYDHCKTFPQVVDPALLQQHVLDAAQMGQIDDPKFLNASRIYLYLGTQDKTYLPGSVTNVYQFFSKFLSSPSTQILFNSTVPSAHCWPTSDSGSPCGTQGAVIENCNYDGPGDCLQHIYEAKLKPPVPFDPSSLFAFDQRPFFGSNSSITGLNSTGYIYIPKTCQTNSTRCLFHVSLHGCSVNEYYDEAVHQLSFVRWAEANEMVVLFPRMGSHGDTKQEQIGCWDAYGQTGWSYDTREGAQMAAVRAMIASVAF